MTSRRHTIRFAAVGVAMSGLMALAACGGDDDGNDDTTTTIEAESDATTAPAGSADPSDETTTDDTATGDTATDDTTADDATTDTTATDTSGIEALSADECRDIYADMQEAGFDPESDEAPEDVGEVYGIIEDAVPDDLKPDVQLLREAFEAIDAARAEAGDNLEDPAYLEALAATDTPEFAAANERLDALFANCEEAVGG